MRCLASGFPAWSVALDRPVRRAPAPAAAARARAARAASAATGGPRACGYSRSMVSSMVCVRLMPPTVSVILAGNASLPALETAVRNRGAHRLLDFALRRDTDGLE